MIKNLILKNKNILYFILIELIILLAIKVIPPYPYGDGHEYILMTEALNNHLTPEIRKTDIEAFYKLTDSYLINEELFNNIGNFTEIEDKKLLDERWGFFVAKNDKIYSYHFWFYSLIIVPIRAFLGFFNLNINLSFLITNTLLMLSVILLIINLKRFSVLEKIITSLLFVFSPVYWYLAWPHPEVFAGSFVFAALLLFYDRKKYTALLLMSLATMHFPPLFIPALLIFASLLKDKGITLKNIFLLFLCSCWIVIPTLFYYLNYGIPNLIIHKGFTSTAFITLNRLHSFFFDLNQGMILAIPLILLLVIGFIIYRAVTFKLNYYYIFIASVFIMAYFYLQMTNWNHGMAVVNRYVVWTSMFFIFIFIYELKQMNKTLKITISSLIITTQAYAIVSPINYKNYFWGTSEFHNSLANWTLNNYPNYYNPDPAIFRHRNSKVSISTTDSVVVYSTPQGIINKMMIRERGAIQQLVLRGISKQKVDSLNDKLKYYQGWAYINKSDLNKLGYSQTSDPLIQIIDLNQTNKLRSVYIEKIMENKSWKNEIEQKARARNITFEEMIDIDVSWLIEEEKKNYYK